MIAAVRAASLAPALALHLASAVAALALGLIVLLRRTGTESHRILGRVWVALMSAAALSSFWLTALATAFR